MKVNKAQVRFEQAVSKVSSAIAEQIAALQEPVGCEAVIAIFKAQECGPEILCAAFWSLDNEPRWHAKHQVWHPRLRNVRNHPLYAEQLFALFRD